MFVTDTVDAVYRPDAWFPEALLDQLADIISDLPASNIRVCDHLGRLSYR
jgi:protein dopey